MEKTNNAKHSVVFNASYGGFSLSKEAMLWLVVNAESEKIKNYCKECLKNDEGDSMGDFYPNIPRHSPDLVKCVESLGEAAGGGGAFLQVCQLQGSQYRIEDYDGVETVIEPWEDKYIEIV